MNGGSAVNPEVSIIIPVYNTRKYIIDCLDSIRAQSVTDYEVILVNDGSTDDSEQIIADYISKNNLSSFHLISKTNGGISSARNVGLSNAKGKWIFFFDSDDWIEPNCLQELLSVANNSGADLVIGGYQAYDQATGQTEVWSNHPCDGGRLPEDFSNLFCFSFIWARLYKKEIIDQYKLKFDERIIYAEDNAWQFDYISHIKSYAYLHSIIYNYRINTGEQITSRLITPTMKRYRFDHLQGFLSKFDSLDVDKSLRENPSFLNVVWEILTDSAVIDLLDKKRKDAKAKIKSPLSKSVLSVFSPRSKKEKFFLFLWKHSFILLRIFVRVYYDNFERLRKSKLLTRISKRK